jgi:hypothetical protein
MTWSDFTELEAAHAAGDEERCRRAIMAMRDALQAAAAAGDPQALAAVRDGELLDLITAEAIAIRPDVGGDITRAARAAMHRPSGWRPDRPRTIHLSPRVRMIRRRPRERRERHIARSTSGADSGDDGPSDDDGPLARLRRAFRRAWRWWA